ncbi:MAG: hypothetical protein AB8H47_13680 [Bacteroidia bacterium]
MRDIFNSDVLFIRFVSTTLISLGLILGLMGVSCKLFYWGYCDINWVPFFGGRTDIPSDLTNLNLPLAMLALGFSSRLFTRFGWAVCQLVLVVLISFFGWLSYSLLTFPELFMASNSAPVIAVQSVPHMESVVVNLGLVFICALSIWYLFVPQVRKLYW